MLNFYLFLGKDVAKNRAFGNNIIFLQEFFPVRGGGFEPPNPSPLRTPLKILRGLLLCFGPKSTVLMKFWGILIKSIIKMIF